jgi:paraquat-inducible protein B
METGSLDTIVTGGISYITPFPKAVRDQSTTFSLYPNKKTALNSDRISITVNFKDCGNLRIGSPVKYKGVEIGEVEDLRFTDNNMEIAALLRIDKEAENFFRSNTKIWLGKAEVSFSGVKNLKTVLFGSFISVQPGSGELTRNFVALTGPPSIPAETIGGLEIVLVSKHLGSLKINSPIYYRQVKVGKVVDYYLSENFKNVHILVNISPEYESLIRENTKFWTVSGAKVEGGLFSGISVTTESLEALIIGGIALATPENSKMGAPVQNHYFFTLHEKVEKEWLDWQPDITLVKKEESVKENIVK